MNEVQVFDKYVIGFAFVGDDVLLIQKTKPDWQAGRFNGVGGKIEAHEHPHVAMHREFMEETGIVTVLDDWQRYATIQIPRRDGHFDAAHCYTTVLSESQMETFNPNATEETVYRMPVRDFLWPDPQVMIANVATLLSAAILKRLSPEIHLTLNY